MLVWLCHPLLSGFLANGHFSQVLHQSHLWDNVNGDNEVKPRAVHVSPGIYLTAQENSGKPELGEPLKALRPHSYISNVVFYLQMRLVGSHSTSWRREETGWTKFFLITFHPAVTGFLERELSHQTFRMLHEH